MTSVLITGANPGPRDAAREDQDADQRDWT